MMDVKRTNPNGGRSILVPPKATIKFDAAGGPKFGPGPEAKGKPAPVQRVGSRNRSAGKDRPDSSRLGSADAGTVTPSSGDASSRRRGSNAGLAVAETSNAGGFGGFGGFGGAIAVDNMPPIAAPRPSTPPSAVPTALNVGIAADDENTDTDTDTADQLDLFSPISTQYKPLADIPTEDIHLSDAVLEAFMQNSPSRAALLNSPLSHRKPSPAVTQMAKMRVVEEMSRIQQRAYVTEQQRQQLMQTALSMDAPKLARRIIQDEKDQDEAVALPTPKKTGIAEAGMHMHDDSSLDTTRTLPTHTLHSQSAVSFLTAGELLMIDRRIQEEKAMLEELNKSNDDSVGDVTKKTASEKKYYNSNSDSNHNSDIDENEVTIKRTKSFRKREQIQMAEDERFAKAVDEVERIRQRFIARAQLPLLGSADYESRGSGRIDTKQATGAVSTVGTRESNAPSTHVGAKVRKTGNGMLFSSRSSFHADEAPHSPAGDLFAPKHAIQQIHYFQSGRISTQNSSGNNSGSISRQNSKPTGSTELSISAGLPAADDSAFPPLSPLKNPSSLLPTQNKRNRRQNYSASPSVGTPSSNEESPSYYPTYDSQIAKSIRPVPVLNSGSIENLNENVYVNPFEAFERANANKPSTMGTFESPSEDNLNSTLRKNNRTRKPAVEGEGTYQQAIADDIDMLIGSRFNSARDLGEPDEPENNEILGNSLVLLQAQLAEAANDEPQQYSRKSIYDSTTTAEATNSEGHVNHDVVSHKHSVDKAPRLLSAAAATALATLSRPNSANRRINSNNSQIHPAVTSAGGVPSAIHIEHDNDPKQYRNVRTPGTGPKTPISVPRRSLLSDESTSSLGSAMFAFKLDSKSTDMTPNTPNSANRNYPNGHHYNTTSSSSTLLVSDTPSPLRNCNSAVSISSSNTGTTDNYSNATFESEVSRGLFKGTSPKGALKEPLSTLNETGNSSFSYTDYMYQSSNDSSRNPNNYTNPASLAPLHASLHPLSTIDAHTDEILKTEHKPQTPQLQPLATPVLHALQPNQASTPDLHIAINASNPNSAEKKAQRTQLARLSSFELNNTNSAHSSNPSTAFSNPGSTRNSSINIPGSTRNTSLSARNSLLAPRTLSRSRGNSVLDQSAIGLNSSIHNAKIRNAQMLLASPLSEWLNAGALVSQKGTINNATGTTLPHIEEGSENHRRSSKFTFEELQQANSLLNAIDGDQSTLVSPSKRENGAHTVIGTADSSRSNSIHSGASLTSLLPSLADATVDPSVVNKVYRSLNVLNSHISNMNSANTSQYTSNVNISPPTVTNTTSANTVEQDLNSLLSENKAVISPLSNPSPTADPINATTGTVNSTGVAGASRPNSRGPRVRGTSTNLTSQSLADGPTTNSVHGAIGANAMPSLSTAKSVTSLHSHNTQETSLSSGDKLSTPVHRELESVMNHAKRREKNALSGMNTDRSANSSISTVNLQRKQPLSSIPSANLDGTSNDKLANASLSSNSTVGSGSAASPAESQAQRLSALAAAFDAGDAVGKLMAQMMLLRKNDNKE